MLRFLLAAVLALASAGAGAATHYIRDGGTASTAGTGSCTGWATANACDTLPATLVRGDTYYIGAGTYSSGTSLSTAVSGTTQITIKGATIADHGAGANWSDSYAVCNGGTRADFPSGWSISTGYWTIDGQCGDGSKGGGATTGYGFRTRAASDGNGAIGFTFSTTVSGINISHYEIDGINCCSMAIGDAGKDGMLCSGGCNVNGVFSRLYIHDVGRTCFLMGGNITLEYSYLARNRSTAPQHAEGWSYRGGTAIIRWNIFEDIRGTGQFVQLYGTGVNHEVYGNVFRLVQGNCPSCSGTVFPVIDNTAQGVINGLKFYNNTIYGLDGNPGVADTNGSTGYVVKNNLWFKNDYGASISGTLSYNHVWGTYWYGGLNGTNSTWRCVQYGGGDPSGNCAGNNSLVSPSAAQTFVGAPGNLQLTGNTVAGISMTGENLGAPYNTDMEGNTRANWTRGAYEYPPAAGLLPAPTNLRWMPL